MALLGSKAAKAPIRLYWLAGLRNFGDAINPGVVAGVTGRPVVHAPAETAEAIGIGSLLTFRATLARLAAPPATQPLIWGTGIIADPGPDFAGITVGPNCLAVRGPLTAARLKGFDGVLGDPGLLCPLIRPRPAAVDGLAPIAYVPHHQQWDEGAPLPADEPDVRLIDVRLRDPWAVVDEIARATVVVSSSLHGLIVADAYGIPNVWVPSNPWMAAKGAFKFRDYFAAVGRRDEMAADLRQGLARARAILARGGADPADPARLEALGRGLRQVLRTAAGSG